MQGKGIPDTLDEARSIVKQTATIDQHSPVPGHWPHSQICALAHLAANLADRVDELERKLNDKPKRGRPPKTAATVTEAEVQRVRAELNA